MQELISMARGLTEELEAAREANDLDEIKRIMPILKAMTDRLSEEFDAILDELPVTSEPEPQ